MRTLYIFLAAALLVVSAGVPAMAGEMGPVEVKKDDKCQVCGMAVAPYPRWETQIVFEDGSYAAFDGPKDMFKFYHNMSKYGKGKSVDDVAEVYVTEYYTTKLMNAREVIFVTGSDVMGPMGHELVPVKGEEAAREFMNDHSGKKMLRFGEVTPEEIPAGKMKMKGM